MYDIVITTYSLLAKEIPTKEQEGAVPGAELSVQGTASPLLRIVWARIILDEAHTVKNPRVQTSMAVCKLRPKPDGLSLEPHSKQLAGHVFPAEVSPLFSI